MSKYALDYLHPAYRDYYCEKHERTHQEDICPLCWHEDREEERAEGQA